MRMIRFAEAQVIGFFGFFSQARAGCLLLNIAASMRLATRRFQLVVEVRRHGRLVISEMKWIEDDNQWLKTLCAKFRVQNELPKEALGKVDRPSVRPGKAARDGTQRGISIGLAYRMFCVSETHCGYKPKFGCE
jgi:hypothetical protein